VDDQFLHELALRENIWLILHINHAQEVSQEVLNVIQKIRKTGTPILNQAVLLRGVNDNVAALQMLCTKLVSIGIFPYYLHHTDRVKGASHFFVSLEEGISLYQELRTKISGVALPRYVIDPEDGSGKIDVEEYLKT
jgi:lysine 2,3-aminomutase